MNVKITLKRKVPVTSYEAIMDVGEPRDRDEILALLELAQENGRINKQIINEKFLFRPENAPYGERILKMLEHYGLVEPDRPSMAWSGATDYRLTAIGHNTLVNKRVMIPERGYYVLHTTEDPVFKEFIIGREKNEESTKEEYEYTLRKYYNRERDPSSQAIEKPPRLKAYEEGAIVRLAANGNDEVQINHIEDTIYKSNANIKVDITVTLEPDSEPTVKTTTAKYGEVALDDHGFKMGFDEALKELVGEDEIKFFNNTLHLLVSYDDLNIREKLSMVKESVPNNHIFKDYGRFDDATITGLPIMPKTLEDAAKWARWLLLNNIRYYVDEPAYEEAKKQASEQFKPIYQPTEVQAGIPSYYKLLEKMREDRDGFEEQGFKKLYWYMNAPRDLSME
jgi:hypothetical protein